MEPLSRTSAVRPRDAATLVLLRGHGRDLELLAGRRPMHLRFMPGVYVFPGGVVDREDRTPWLCERGAGTLPQRLRTPARAALRETWEETQLLLGETAPAHAGPGARAVERAYLDAGLVAAFDRLTYLGRAITPASSSRRYNTRFFLADGDHAVGTPRGCSTEFEDLAWHPIGRSDLSPLRDVTQFMLARAIAVRTGTAAPEPPLFAYREGLGHLILVCREGRLRGAEALSQRAPAG